MCRWAHPGDEDKKRGLPCPGKAVRAGRAEAEEESQEEAADAAHVLSLQQCPRLCSTTESCSVVGSTGSYFMSHPSAGNPATKRGAVSTCGVCSQPVTSDGAVGMGAEGRRRMFTDPPRAAQGAGAGAHLLSTAQCGTPKYFGRGDTRDARNLGKVGAPPGTNPLCPLVSRVWQ